MGIGNLDIVNEEFSSDDEIELLTPFVNNENVIFGEIKLAGLLKEDLNFDVEIPKSYPFSDSDISVRFCVKGEPEAAHINLDNSICIHTPRHQDFRARLKFEISSLKEWRDKYYIRQEKDERYEYLITSYADNSCFLFTNVSGDFKKCEFGEFKYSIFSDHCIKSKGIVAEQAFILQIGGHKCDWSQIVHSQRSSTGFFVFIENEPIKRPFRIVTDWSELEPFLNEKFLKMLYDYKSRNLKPHLITLLIGYNIGDGNYKEIHWQLVSLMSNEIPLYGRKIGPKQYESSCYEQEINWTKCVNAEYSRFFGRGRLSQKLTSKKVLIIGIGAVGSRLAAILVRSGARFIDVCDGDIVEPGNICRSDYYLIENQLPKTVALKRHLEAISPFVDVAIKDKLSKRTDGDKGIKTKDLLESYDLVIDCTSDNELSYLIDQLDLECTTANISISNEAKELVLITGSKLTNQKKTIFSQLGPSEPELIYEGTGCWSPTFKAAGYDIDSMLNLLVQNINHQIESTDTIRTLVVKREIIENKVMLRTIDY